ncbi:hypothetical protein [Ruegeria denitrificans]|uniref:hypothetical protein n=1 Tax=Ruegeria denitrificans TaxID=1715692 RepID=UPI00103944F6|nr:hypothetical protein [Ruegeria denitrificans]
MAKIEYVTNFLLVFLSLNHLLSWYGDVKSFAAWNHPGKVVPKGDIDDDASEPVSRLEHLALRIEDYIELQENLLRDADQRPIRDMRQYAGKISQTARDLEKSTSRLEQHAQLYLWGWYLALPIGSAAYALWL